MAPMASNRTDKVQSSSSQPPANITSCLPNWMISAALPMQWFEVAQAAAIDALGRVEGGRAVDLGAEAELGLVVGERDAGLRLAERGEHLLRGVADGRDDAHPRDDDASHRALSGLDPKGVN